MSRLPRRTFRGRQYLKKPIIFTGFMRSYTIAYPIFYSQDHASRAFENVVGRIARVRSGSDPKAGGSTQVSYIFAENINFKEHVSEIAYF